MENKELGKESNNQYAVIDKKQGKLVGLYTTRQEAWTKWQEQWMGKDAWIIDDFTLGRFKNVKKYLK